MEVYTRILVRANLSGTPIFDLNAGKGFRWAHIFSENTNLLAGNRSLVLASDLAPEEATIWDQLHPNLHWDQINITLSGDAYLTYFQNQIFPGL